MAHVNPVMPFRYGLPGCIYSRLDPNPSTDIGRSPTRYEWFVASCNYFSVRCRGDFGLFSLDHFQTVI